MPGQKGRKYLLEHNYRELLKNINDAAERSGRSPDSVRLIAVTKTVGVEEVQRAAGLGIADFGENRVQEAAAKVKQMPELRWHFIGHLQSNKVKDVLPYYSLIHSLDRPSLLKALQQCAERYDRVVEVLVQVNTSGEESKFGLAPEKLTRFLEEVSACSRIRIKGLMTMAPFVDNPEETRPCFNALRRLRDENVAAGWQLPELSMGMTNDYTVAVEEGATLVRIGTALFGPRD